MKTVNKMVLTALMTLSAQTWAGTVTVSNYPLSLLSNAVTAGSESASVLLGAGDVGHHGSLSPSGVKLITDSQYVVWFGTELEQNLVNNLQNAPNAISLYRLNAFKRLPMRDINGAVREGSFDPHIWLDPDNAKAIVRALAVVHAHANPDKRPLYQANAHKFAQRMDAAVAQVLSDTQRPYWAYHDAYQYLEKSAKLSFMGALTPDHHLSPKASQIKQLSSNRPKAQMCLVAQGEVSDGIRNKLGQVNVITRQEDMSDGDDFVVAWG